MHCSFGLKFGKPEPTREPLFAQILPNILKMIYAIDSTKQHPFLIRPLSLKNRNVPFLSLAKVLLRSFAMFSCSANIDLDWVQLSSFDPFTKVGMKTSR